MKKKLMLILSCLFLSVGFLAAQTKVSGTVVDDTGEALISVSVVVKGTTVGTVTDLDGKFSINMPEGKNTLSFRLVGMKNVEIPAKDGMRVVMQEDLAMLDEVVVVAYGTSKKEALTGSVAAVSSKDLIKRPVANVGAAMEGMGAGIQVNNSIGEPGADPTFRIRGVSSMIGSNDPLIVLDGAPFSGSLSTISPEDIENISVLKDAASAALYGSRAANGVVLVTTKRGRVGEKGTLSLTIRQGITQRAANEYRKVGANDFMETSWAGYRNGLYGSGKYSLVEASQLASNSLVSDILGYNIYNVADKDLFNVNGKLNPKASILPGIKGDLDWFDAMERTGYRQEYSLSGTSATEKMSVFYSASYLDEKGYVKTSDFNRFTGRVGVTYTPRKWLKTGVTLSGSYAKQNQTQADGKESFVNAFYYARSIAPIYPVHAHDMETGDYLRDKDGNKIYDAGENPVRPQHTSRHALWENELNMMKRKTNRTSLQAFAEISFLKDFKFTVKGDLDVRTVKESDYNNQIIGDGAGAGRLINTNYDFKEYLFSQQLTWSKTFSDVHNLDALFVHEYNVFDKERLFGMKQNQMVDGIPYFVNFSTTDDLTSRKDIHRIESYLGRVRYNYDEKYFGEFSFRRDGSSMFHPNSRWGNFWAVGGSWIASRENFLKDFNWLNMLKLRASYGQVGNDGFYDTLDANRVNDFYPYMSLYGLEHNGGEGALYRTTVGNPDLKWESLQNFSVGLEGRVLNRINFSFEYFEKRNKDLLNNFELPLSQGSTNMNTASPTIMRNVGTMKNYGFELSLDGDIIATRDWRWNLGFDITLMKNKIVKMPAETRVKGQVKGNKKWMEGKSIYEFFVYQWAGVDQLTGEGLYIADPDKKEANPNAAYFRTIGGKDYTTDYSSAKKDYSGSAIPDAFGSIRTSLSYKDFDFSLLCTYGIGGKMLDYTYASYMSVSANPTALHKDILDAWTKAPAGMTEDSPNRINSKGVPELNNETISNRHTAASSRFITDASYFSIKNITFSYRLPKPFVSKFDLSSISLGASIENAAIFSKRRGLDPQQAFNGNVEYKFAPMRVFSFSLNVTL